MIIVMKRGATPLQIDRVIKHIEHAGMRCQVIDGTGWTALAALGDKGPANLDTLDGVDKVVPLGLPYQLAGAGPDRLPTTLQVRNLALGAGRIAVIAGPCSVESRQQILDIAHLVREAGATGLRGGAFKPRTSPYSFQGMGERGLELLAEARTQTGLAVVTEVMAPEQVAIVARYADVLQVGARNMRNYPLLVTAGESGLPILLKRGFSATMEEFLLAAEYILKTGNARVMLCERGIRTFEDHTRFTLALASVPYLHETTHLPVVVDPSHGTGKASLVAPMALAAVAAGADGLLVEVHADPAAALSDGFQALVPAGFRQMMADCRKVAAALGKTL